MRYSIPVVLAFVTGCREEGVLETDCPEETAVEIGETTYAVSVGGGQTAITNTTLQFVSGTYEVHEDPYSGVDLQCFTLTLQVPAEAGQGVIIESLDYLEIGLDEHSTSWTNGFVSIANGPGDLWLGGDLNIYASPNDSFDAVSYNTDSYFGNNANIAEQFGCMGPTLCGTTMFYSTPRHYVPVGGQAIIGACTAWVQYDSNTDYQTENNWRGAYGTAGENDWHALVIDQIRWTPSDDAQGVHADGITGLWLPTEALTFAQE